LSGNCPKSSIKKAAFESVKINLVFWQSSKAAYKTKTDSFFFKSRFLRAVFQIPFWGDI